MEVSEETVDYLIEMKRIDKKVETREYRALVSFGYDDVHTAECCGVSSPATDEVFFEKMENKELYLALEKLNPSMSRRFYLYSVYGFTLERIGEMEGVSHTAVFKSIRRTAKLLRKYLSENN
ncbi:MAG TPA: sigma-70 family RNA polymerase sigma factor [Clostridiales bacterium]|nr:sigma-70 family RNA polymerase sigma factor [Clostridiales bacterium]